MLASSLGPSLAGLSIIIDNYSSILLAGLEVQLSLIIDAGLYLEVSDIPRCL